MPVRSLGYVSFQTPAVDQWRSFGGDFLGLMPVAGADPEALYFRLDDYPQRLSVKGGPEVALLALGLEVANERELRSVADAVTAAGVEVAPLSPAVCAERRVTAGVAFRDPGGNPLELFYGPVLDHTPVRTPTVSRFVTGDMGMGHAIVSVADSRKASDFYMDVLGFWERNTMTLPDGPLWFLGCNPRHHTIGVMPAGGPGLVHLMVEVATLDDVGLALDRADRLGVPIMNTLGKHTNDHMVSFYVYSPELCAVEVGWNGMRVDGAQPTYEITAGAFWGHKMSPPPPSVAGGGPQGGPGGDVAP